MKLCESLSLQCSRRNKSFKYFVLCTIERKRSCKIFLAFRVPAKALCVDYTISNAEMLLQHGFRVREGEVVEDVAERTKRGHIHLDPDGADTLDHYCESRMLCILKRYHCPEDRKEDDMRKRSINEIKSLQRLRRCKNVVTLLESFEYEGSTYCVMEYVWRGSLWALIRRNKHLDLETTRLFAFQVAQAIGEIHASGISHRDLTSSNIMIGSSGNLKIIDFNLCKRLDSKNTRMNSFVGTYSAMPPEVLHCSPRSGQKSTGTSYSKEIDWWYLGIMVYEMLTGKQPFAIEGNLTRMGFYNKVARSPHEVDFSSIEDPCAKDLITQLLQAELSERLGATGGVSHILKHKFFLGVKNTLDNSATLTDYIDARILECIKAIIAGERDR
ncbi:kinase domain containing protein [Babesia ovis]|uniref:Kinase domain containing protein n=1 Tax=Babesia ovis TaxID=5869 RepID=A0A9W5T9G9_BABOV|nr:kinase domain containing protein [Babesia ovis]